MPFEIVFFGVPVICWLITSTPRTPRRIGYGALATAALAILVFAVSGGDEHLGHVEQIVSAALASIAGGIGALFGLTKAALRHRGALTREGRAPERIAWALAGAAALWIGVITVFG